MADAIDSYAIIGLLRAKYGGEEWATFAELVTATGFRKSRALDFFALNTWPSKKFRSIAFEVKVSRADFQKELNEPDKRAEAEALATECFFVTPRGLVEKDEVPEGWGLMVVQKNGLRILKNARQRNPEPWPLHFVAMIARRSADPKTKLGAKAWLQAGKEVDEATLIEIANDVAWSELKRREAELIQQGENAMAERVQPLQVMRQKISDLCGFSASRGADGFERWFRDNANANISPPLLNSIRAAQTALDEVMKRAGE